MKLDDATYQEESISDHAQLTRRFWLQGMACCVGLSVAGPSMSVAATPQDSRMADVIRAMSALTGTDLAENWVGPTASLVAVILDYSKAMRQLDLGELEPPTNFLPR